MRLRSGLVVVGLLVGGCTVGPDYVPPQTPVPTAWSGAAASQPASSQPAITSDSGDLAEWWKTLNDPMLDTLILEAMDSNLELRAAAARIREARAARSAAAASFWPQINGTGGYTYSGSSLNTQQDNSKSVSFGRQMLSNAVGAAGSALTSGGAGQTTPVNQLTGSSLAGSMLNQVSQRLGQTEVDEPSRGRHLFQAGLDASWELDLFGGIRRSVEASDADLQAAEASRQDLVVSLLAEVAVNYIELRGAQRRLEIAQSNIVTQENTLRLTQARKGAGFANQLEVAQAEAQLQSTRSQVPLLQASIRQSVFALSVLLGQPPKALLDDLLPAGLLPVSPPELPVGVPSDLLRRRPDIRQAERTLAAETARIGVATADLFPRVSLNGGFGTQTVDAQHFLDRNSVYWTLGPSVQWALFQGGRIRANIAAQEARTEQTLISYQQTVLNALQETENAMVAYTSERARYEALAAAVEANERAVRLSNQLYSGGIGAFLNVLEAHRSLFTTQDALAVSQIAAMTDLVAIYKALGGGWSAFPD